MSAKSNRKTCSRKAAIDRPKKPYPAFPLTPHNAGSWMKKIRGKIYYFGRWGRVVKGKMERLSGDGWEEALRLYKAQADDLHAGRTPRLVSSDGLTVRDLCNRFLTAKQRKLSSGELIARTFQEYRATTDRLVSMFGMDRLVDDLAADDFESLRAEIATVWGPVRLGNEITRVRSVFKYAIDNGLIDRPVRYGSEFQKPGKSVLRSLKAANGKKLIEADEIRLLLGAATVQLKAMVLLGVNCGLGNTDCADLPQTAVDLNTGWIDFPRPKTGIERRCPLWPESVEALREAIEQRAEPKDKADDADCVFLTSQGKRWVRPTTTSRTDGVTREFGNLSRRLGINGRKGLGFYTLRHVFRTIADGSRDQVAANLIMGRSDPTMAGIYRESIDDSRLVAVTDHVHAWLFGKGSEA